MLTISGASTGFGRLSAYPRTSLPKWFSVGGATVRTSPDDVQALERIYIFREIAPIYQFLEDHPYLVPVLFSAYVNILEYFPGALLYLEKFVDRENAEEVQLIVTIVSSLDVETAFARLNEFDDSYWLDEMDAARGMLLITL